ncbi:hypothetical protein QBC46DRAFT_252538 [Diplogelasinospora grovesii]|uniref:Uncharacterized protein n=1 Tax=Diplogelasinospora grovesii TaxID=303347 RepID=A0AAN6S8Z1_9PEZI|nr:hypothetical protein QBC46DRAFT_252538 [Diplogelasinospora grovesii]
MVHMGDTENFLRSGAWTTARSESPRLYGPPSRPDQTYKGESSVPRSYRISLRYKRPPRPCVEDEAESLAKEFGGLARLAASKEEPPFRGTIDQHDLLVEVAPRSYTSGFTTNPEYEANTCRQYVLYNTCRQYVLCTPSEESNPEDDKNKDDKYFKEPEDKRGGRDSQKPPELKKRKSHQDLPPLNTDTRREEPSLRRSNSRRTQEKKALVHVNQELQAYTDHEESVTSPLDDYSTTPIITYSNEDNDRGYWDSGPRRNGKSSRKQTGKSSPQVVKAGDRRSTQYYSPSTRLSPNRSSAPPPQKRNLSAADVPSDALEKWSVDGQPGGYVDSHEKEQPPRGNTKTPAARYPRDDKETMPGGFRSRNEPRKPAARERKESSESEYTPSYSASYSSDEEEEEENTDSEYEYTKSQRSPNLDLYRPPFIIDPKDPFKPEPVYNLPNPFLSAGDYTSPTLPGGAFGPWGPNEGNRGKTRPRAHSNLPERKPPPVPARAHTRHNSYDPSTSAGGWQQGPPAPLQYLENTERVTSFRRYVEATKKGSRRPFPNCRWKNPTPFFNEATRSWDTNNAEYFLTLPDASNFTICHECFEAVSSNITFRDSFVPARAYTSPTQKAPLTCDFGSSIWCRIAFLKSYDDPRLLGAVTTAVKGSPKCTGNKLTSATEYSIMNPRANETIRGFRTCKTCAKIVHILLPNLKNIFVGLTPRIITDGICALRFTPHRRRFLIYFDLLETASECARTLGMAPDLQGLADRIQEVSRGYECNRDVAVENRDWHVMEGLEGFAVCEECYKDVVRPLVDLRRGSWSEVDALEGCFFKTKKRIRGKVSCQLYSDHMRAVFHEACRRNDIDYLDDELHNWNAIIADLKAKHASLRSKKDPNVLAQLSQVLAELNRYGIDTSEMKPDNQI